MKTPKGCLTISEAMRRMGVSRVTIWRMVKKKELRLVVQRWRKFVRVEDLERLNGVL